MLRSSERRNLRCAIVLDLLVVLAASLAGPDAISQGPPAKSATVLIEGTVRSATGRAVAGASVVLEGKSVSPPTTTTTDMNGNFSFADLRAGTYCLRTAKVNLGSAIAEALLLAPGEKKRADLVLNPNVETKVCSRGALPSSPTEKLELEDKPIFAVAGITDWTAAGGHGSDVTLRTSESLVRDTIALRSQPIRDASPGSSLDRKGSESEAALRGALEQSPDSFDANLQLGTLYCHLGRYREAIPLLETAFRVKPGDYDSAYGLAVAYQGMGNNKQAREQVQVLLKTRDEAQLHRWLGDLDEELRDPVEAVHEYEVAARMDPSERNYFAWATELLFHRAIGPAVDVFQRGVSAHPGSGRMLAGLAAALYGSGSYSKAARCACDASDLNPADPTLYVFMGKMNETAPETLPCVEEKMERFVHDQPGNALANYYGAMVLWKKESRPENPGGSPRVESLLEKAASIDPTFAEPHLQLGTLYFERGEIDQAISAYNKAVELKPGIAEAHYRLGQIYKKMGDTAKAKQEIDAFEQARQSDAAAVERQRREIKQFLVVFKEQPVSPAPH